MLIYNEETIEMEKLVDELIDSLKENGQYQKLVEAKKHFLSNRELQNEIHQFELERNQFLEQEAYLKYRPELKAKKLTLIRQKRKLDLQADTADLKLAEYEFQAVLDSCLASIASCFSESIEVSTTNFQIKKGGHHGKCHVN
ncbi:MULTISPECIES: YlbF family regulator [unclassified Enterococcus]|uniref:YlbF family regulator n=1 Tax=unclassified Enterococcus TaxID=2608891 RepID=UPI001555B4FF|nr:MULTISPECIES: YlbF family regulator [unclassified Enterococcus]MBS7576142.1 YlbF family regulator [Enterococcus sp. MMGLQ5-2]MBS7583375.1 YlbF family regulator [Enterococcus sp. MMGLQ5-1]NPD11235.1 YlbF family regulator [Enterococcus sp. MMGLQ5-1]NPD35978.1 YlbF family regulator [Enterococcus sp. MMGLQ5-2]